MPSIVSPRAVTGCGRPFHKSWRRGWWWQLDRVLAVAGVFGQCGRALAGQASAIPRPRPVSAGTNGRLDRFGEGQSHPRSSTPSRGSPSATSTRKTVVIPDG